MESTRLTALAHGCHQDDAVRRTEGALVTLKDSLKKEKRLREELAEHLVRELMDQAKANGGKAVLVREEYELEALSYLSGRASCRASIFLLPCAVWDSLETPLTLQASTRWHRRTKPVSWPLTRPLEAVLSSCQAKRQALLQRSSSRLSRADSKVAAKDGGKANWKGKSTKRTRR